MKKFLTGFLLMVTFFAVISPVMAENVELSGMDYKSLMELKQAVDTELYSRPEAEPRMLSPGKYIVGEDVKAGRYYITVNSYIFNEACTARIKIYETAEAESALQTEWLSLNEASISIVLQEGNVLCVDHFPVTLSARELEDDQKYKYAVPEGTYVPVGVYEVGKDVPAGSYQVYMGTIYGGDVFVYANDESYKEKTYETRAELMVIWQDHVESISVQEGNVIVIKKDVVMRKQKQLTFE